MTLKSIFEKHYLFFCYLAIEETNKRMLRLQYIRPIISSNKDRYLNSCHQAAMPFKKLELDEIPDDVYIKDKDHMGKWIECDICDVKIIVRSQFCFIEWDTHCSGVKHCKIANSKILQNVPQKKCI